MCIRDSYKMELPSIIVSYANEGARTKIDELKKVKFSKRSNKAAQGDVYKRQLSSCVRMIPVTTPMSPLLMLATFCVCMTLSP